MIRAQNRTRTCTSLLTLVPETSASTIPPPGQEHESKKCYVSGKRDSNSRPQPWQGCALPTELFPHCVFLNITSEEEETRTPTTQLSLPPQSSASTNSATSPFSKTPYSKQNSCCFKMLSGKRDSDPRPQPWQGCALPTELFPLVLLFVVALSLKRDAKVRLFS